MDGEKDGSRMLELDVTARNDSKPKGNKKKKAQASSKRKRGATSKTGKGIGSQKTDSSQQIISTYFNCLERPVEVGNSLGSSLTATNTS